MDEDDDSKPSYASAKPADVPLNQPGQDKPPPDDMPSATGGGHKTNRSKFRLRKMDRKFIVMIATALIGVFVILPNIVALFDVITPQVPTSPQQQNNADTQKVRVSTQKKGGRYQETLAARREIMGRELVQDDDIRAVAELQLELEQDRVHLWAKAAFEEAIAYASAADQYHQQNQWHEAAQHYQAAEQAFSLIKASWPDVLDSKLRAINEDLQARRLPEAQAKIIALQEIQPELPRLALLQSKLEQLPALFDFIKEAEALLHLNQLEDAAALSAKGAQIDARFPGLQALERRIQDAILQRDFQQAMTKGLQAIAQKHFADAVAAFNKAVKLKPKDSAAREGLLDAQARFRLERLTQIRSQAKAAERNEQWEEAAQLYWEGKQLAGDIDAFNKGYQRSQKRKLLDEKLAALVAADTTFYDESQRGYGWEILELGRKINPKGTRLKAQLQQIEASLRAAVLPAVLTIKSDKKTTIEIHKLGYFGTFKARDFELLPGEYTVRGTRRGYRDVLHIFKIQPGLGQKTLTVRCEEKI